MNKNDCDHYFPVIRGKTGWKLGPCEFCGQKKQTIKIKRPKGPSNTDKLFIRTIQQVCKVEVIPEFRFTDNRMWRVDFAIPSHLIAIEVEGGRFKKRSYTDKKTGMELHTTGGRHNSGKGFQNDMEKYNSLACKGYILLRTTPEDLLTAKTIENVSICVRNAENLKKNGFFVSKQLP